MLLRTQVKPEWALATVAQALKIPANKSGEIGLEFELEGQDLGIVASTINQKVTGKVYVWKAELDGSLGEAGMEFILAKPLDRHLAVEAVEELFYLLQTKSKLGLTRRCSTHVHMNFSTMVVNQVFLFLTLYYVLEEALFKAIAPDRFYNNYCVPISLSDTITEELRAILQAQSFHATPTPSKYKALNYGALKTYGSIENRMMGGASKPSEVFKWLDVLMEIYDIAKNNERLAPDFFLQQFSGKGFILYLQEYLPKTWDFIKDLPDVSRMLNRGVWFAQDIAFMLDWSPVVDGIKPKKVRASDNPPPNFTTNAHSPLWSTGTVSSTASHEDDLP